MLKKLNTWKRNDKKIDEARKKLNDSVGLGRRDSIEYLAPGESGRAEDEAGGRALRRQSSKNADRHED